MTSSNTTKNIGLLVLDLQLDYSVSIAKGMTEVATAKNINLVIFPIEQPKVDSGSSDEPSVVHDLLRNAPIDALVVVTSSLVNFLSFSQFSRELDKLHDIPILSIGAELKNHPSIVNDNKKGLVEAITHLIEDQGYERIAFVRGPLMHPEAEERYAAYLDTLKKHDMPIDMDYVSVGNFTFEAGIEAANRFCELEKGPPHAIVCANDDMACGVLHVLEERGVEVPGHIAVVGYDNIREAAFTNPPLSSVDQPVLDIGRQSAKLALAMANGEKVDHLTVIPTRFVRRSSCGRGASLTKKQESLGTIDNDKTVTLEKVLEWIVTDALTKNQLGKLAGWLLSLNPDEFHTLDLTDSFLLVLNSNNIREEMSQIISENLLVIKTLIMDYRTDSFANEVFYALSSTSSQYFYALSVQKSLKIDNRFLQLRNLISLAAKKSSTYDFFRSLHKFLQSIDFQFFYIVLHHDKDTEGQNGGIDKCTTVFGYHKANESSNFNNYEHPPNILYLDEKNELSGEVFNVEPLIYLGHCFGHICYSWDSEDRYTRLSFSSIISAKLRSDKLWNDYLDLENLVNSNHDSMDDVGIKATNSHLLKANLLDQKEFYIKANREFENSKISHAILPMVFVRLANYDSIFEEFGEEYIDIYVNYISESLAGFFGACSLITRSKSDMFVVLSPKVTPKDIDDTLENLKEKIRQYKNETDIAVEFRLESAVNHIHPDTHRSLVDHIGDADYLLTRIAN